MSLFEGLKVTTFVTEPRSHDTVGRLPLHALRAGPGSQLLRGGQRSLRQVRRPRRANDACGRPPTARAGVFFLPKRPQTESLA